MEILNLDNLKILHTIDIFLHIGCTTGLNWKKIAQLGFLIYRAIYFLFLPTLCLKILFLFRNSILIKKKIKVQNVTIQTLEIQFKIYKIFSIYYFHSPHYMSSSLQVFECMQYTLCALLLYYLLYERTTIVIKNIYRRPI